MTARELLRWQAYETVYGSVLPHERIDAGFAQVSMILAQAFSSNGRRYSVRDFMPPWYQDLTENEAIGRELAALQGMIHADD